MFSYILPKEILYCNKINSIQPSIKLIQHFSLKKACYKKLYMPIMSRKVKIMNKKVKVQ